MIIAMRSALKRRSCYIDLAVKTVKIQVFVLYSIFNELLRYILNPYFQFVDSKISATIFVPFDYYSESKIEYLQISSSNLTASKQQFRSNWSNYTPSQLENSFVSNIHRLFSERIEIFSSVEFSKVSIVTGIIKISLKVNRASNHAFSS